MHATKLPFCQSVLRLHNIYLLYSSYLKCLHMLLQSEVFFCTLAFL